MWNPINIKQHAILAVFEKELKAQKLKLQVEIQQNNNARHLIRGTIYFASIDPHTMIVVNYEYQHDKPFGSVLATVVDKLRSMILSMAIKESKKQLSLFKNS